MSARGRKRRRHRRRLWRHHVDAHFIARLHEHTRRMEIESAVRRTFDDRRPFRTIREAVEGLHAAADRARPRPE